MYKPVKFDKTAPQTRTLSASKPNTDKPEARELCEPPAEIPRNKTQEKQP